MEKYQIFTFYKCVGAVRRWVCAVLYKLRAIHITVGNIDITVNSYLPVCTFDKGILRLHFKMFYQKVFGYRNLFSLINELSS